MNKHELIDLIAKKSELTKKDTTKTLNAFVEVVREALVDGEEVKISGLGKFMTVERKERVGRNPKTNEEIKIESCRVPRFKAGKELKESVKDQ